MIRRCGRLDDHTPHDWTGHDPAAPGATYSCTGHVLTAYAEQQWALEADAADAAADDQRAYEREVHGR